MLNHICEIKIDFNFRFHSEDILATEWISSMPFFLSLLVTTPVVTFQNNFLSILITIVKYGISLINYMLYQNPFYISPCIFFPHVNNFPFGVQGLEINLVNIPMYSQRMLMVTVS